MNSTVFQEEQLVRCVDTFGNKALQINKLYIVSCVFNNVRMNVYDPLITDGEDKIHFTNIIIDTFSYNFAPASKEEVEWYVSTRKNLLFEKINRINESIVMLNGK